ncbi:NAD(P)H-quinone oxidoreductase [Avibacterium sp. 21-599]|uniref:NAD(P)H-quinone oxidoreductase n=1 Tax=Avibacterium sp. 21-599 TaxID=2911528 RepID=UPI002247A910|nr:NAD(P)H-quinone oxidoreductase [Avibacterium sp. 21-599]MCW9717850.1 NAD(P)H-quinone oxidoreductase [Avibacterium sp. 21-599]
MTMQQIAMREAGAPDVLFIQQATIPTPRAGELLVKVAYAGINRPDIMQRQGLYPMPKGVTPIMGLELSGTVVAIGEGVSGFQLGDKICALTDGGAYAEYCLVPASQALPIPKNYSLVEAAALPETLFTVWVNLFMQQQVKAGEHLLVHGGTSGIGLTALAIAKSLGIKTYATVGNTEKCTIVEQYGAVAINYKTQDFAEVIKQAGGVDAILDVVGASYFQRNLDCLKQNGRLFLIGFMGGAVASNVDLLQIALKRVHITGSTMRSRTKEEKAEIAQSLKENVWHQFENEQIGKPIIHQVFDFKEVKQAHQEMDKGTHIGKIMLAFDKTQTI